MNELVCAVNGGRLMMSVKWLLLGGAVVVLVDERGVRW